MNKKELIDFVDWIKKNCPPHKMYTSTQIVELWEKSIDSLPNEEASSVSENEQQRKLCVLYNECKSTFKSIRGCSKPLYQCYLDV